MANIGDLLKRNECNNFSLKLLIISIKGNVDGHMRIRFLILAVTYELSTKHIFQNKSEYFKLVNCFMSGFLDWIKSDYGLTLKKLHK